MMLNNPSKLSLVSSGATGHCPYCLPLLSLISLCFRLFSGLFPTFKFVFTFQVGSPLPTLPKAPQAKPVRQSHTVAPRAQNTADPIILSFHISSTSECSADESPAITTSAEHFKAAFLQASSRFVVSLFIQTNHKAKRRHMA